MTDDLRQKTCLVTGASRGIGAAIARMLADRGAQVAVHYGRNRELAEAVASALSGSGHFVVGADLADVDTAPGLVEDVVDRTGRIDVLVNNAGIFVPHATLEVDSDEWRTRWEETLAVNLLAPAALCHAAVAVMARQGGGRIINVGSRGAFRGEPEAPAYGASKAGLHAMSQSLAVALAPRGILVFAIAPGWVDTDMAAPDLESAAGPGIKAQSPLGRIARPEEVAATACFLALSAPEYLTGAIIDINGASYLRS